MQRDVGTGLMAVGAVLVVVGLLARSGALAWFGRLPGDLRWEGEHGGVYVPLTTMLIVSAVLTLISWLLGPRG